MTMLDESIINSFKKIVGNDNVLTDNATLLAYSYDSTPQFQALPDAVISPNNTNEIATLVKYCNQHKIPLIPRGSGTNLSAGTTPLYGGIVLLFTHMNQILEIDERNLTMTVQPGVYTQTIHQAAE